MAPAAASEAVGVAGSGDPPKDAWRGVVMRYVHRFVPVSRWYRTVTPKTIVGDGIAGFIVGVMIVPTCLSWSSLAGLPLSCGLIAALVASFTYGTFGQCASLSMGPVAEITTLLISIPGIPAEKRKDTFQSLGVQVGIVSIALSFVDCGTVIKTIFAKAVGDGYTCAAALLAISAQLKVMFNVVPEDLGYGNFINTIVALWSKWTAKSFYCFLLFLVYCTYLIQIKKTRLPLWIPHQLIVVVLSILVTWGFRLDERLDLAIVRDIPASLSWPRFPPMDNLVGLGPYTLTITVISFVQMYVVAQRVMPDIDPNAELFAGGVTNLLVNLMSGMPVSNSFSCSSVLIEQKVHTPLTAYAAGTVVLITILFLTRLGVFYYLPKQALAAIVVSSVWRLVNFSGPAQLWRYSRKDAGVWVLTFVLTVVGGITIGVLSGIAFSLILVVLRIARPRAVSVGFNMQTFRYGDIRKDPELLVYPNILMWRFDAPLYFINTGFFQERLVAAIAAEVRPIDVVLVTCGKVVDIDAAALASLPNILDGIAKSDPARPRRIILTDIHGRLEKVLLDSAALPIYVPEEYDRLSIAQITASSKFPVVFKRLEEAIAFGQRCISERYGNVDTAPYPNVSFLTDVVMKAARLPTGEGRTPAFLSLLEAEHVRPTTSPAPPRPNTLPHIVVTAPGEARPAVPGRATPAGGGGNDGDDGGDKSDSDGDGDASQQQDSLVRHLATLRKLSTYSPDRELVGVLGVIRHGEVTPKQKKKLLFSDPALLRLAFHGRDLRRTRRSVEELADFFVVVERLLWGSPALNESVAGSSDGMEASFLGATNASTSGSRVSTAVVESWMRVLSIVRSRPDGLKIQVKARVTSGSGTGSFAGSGQVSPSQHHHHRQQVPHGASSWRRVGGGGGGGASRRSSSSIGSADEDLAEPTAGLLVVKWGGVLTKSGISQAHLMGEKLFARFYAAGDLPLRRLVQFTGRPLVTASDENRVVDTALVVANALTQTSGDVLRRGDIVLNDALTKTLGPIAKRLLREEYRYFESLLHIESAAAARHFFHIPGFRQLLWIPPLDRPLGWGGSDYGDDEYNGDGDDEDDDDGDRDAGGGGDAGATARTRELSDTGSTVTESDGDGHGRVDASAAKPSRRARRPASDRASPRSFRYQGAQDISMAHGSRAFAGPVEQQQQQQPNYNVLRQDEFYTPYQVLQELEELMTILSTLEFPVYLAKVPLSNHETMQELQQRYEAMLNNFEGAKRRIRNGERPSGHTLGLGTSGAAVRRAGGAAAAAAVEEDADAQMLLEAMEETGGSSDEDGFSAQLVEEPELLPDVAHRRDTSTPSGAPTTARPSFLLAPSSSGVTTRRGEGDHGHSPPLQQRPRRGEAANGDGGGGGGGHHHHATDRASPYVAVTQSGPRYAPLGFDSGRGGNGRGQSETPPRFDVSDVSKLRDYGSYDVAYNLPLVVQLHASVQDAAAAFQLRRFARALQRFSGLTEYLSRIGENVLEGVNSSKRFIIGSLVSDALLRKLHSDFRDLAATDEERGVQELLLKAQAQHMMENGGVEHDVRHMIDLCSRLPCWPTLTKGSRRADERGGGAAWAGDARARETPQEREFRLRFPFIALPKLEPRTRAAAADFADCTRLYFTSYLHVEGVLQCLFESATVEGFSRPSKEEMEATHQLYMRHLVFKIFRRRNVSYTDAEVAAAMRRLHLLFRSDVDYDKQQHELRRGLAAIYHAMYYVSMEVYLSLGDADEAQTAMTEERPLLSLPRTGPDDDDGDGGGGGDGMDAQAVRAACEREEGLGEATVVVRGVEEARVGSLSPLLPSFAVSGAASCASSRPASHAAAGVSSRTAAPGGGATTNALLSAARSPLHVQHLVSAASDADTSGTPLASGGGGGGGGVPAWVTSPLSPSTSASAAAAAAAAPRATGSALPWSDTEDDESPGRSRRRETRTSTLAANAGAPQCSPKTRSRSMAAVPTNTKEPVREATVLVTPEAGRRTAVVQGMKHRVSNVTPMRRIHEGISLNDFVLLMKEVESAVRSQTSSPAH
ncbi:sulfate transporter-like protein [Novymonas esmeraldas]|uniref:Sulfate transporter-like protein n=1 Tax=Novymonas esmeraldas TaxID=1808958 RepID=A0AAW0EPB4_9TRYP